MEDLFPLLFTELGRIQQEFTIKLREGAKPFAVKHHQLPAVEHSLVQNCRGSMFLKTRRTFEIFGKFIVRRIGFVDFIYHTFWLLLF